MYITERMMAMACRYLMKLNMWNNSLTSMEGLRQDNISRQLYRKKIHFLEPHFQAVPVPTLRASTPHHQKFIKFRKETIFWEIYEQFKYNIHINKYLKGFLQNYKKISLDFSYCTRKISL
jgi:hypothetical protein